MAAHRYWRSVGLEAYGAGDLELSGFHLLSAGERVDAGAALTASIAPDVSGTLADLQDDVLTTAARWSEQAVKSLVLSWDFGDSPADVDGIELAGDSETLFLLIAKIQWSDDATAWTSLATVAGITWPGARAKTTSANYVQRVLSLAPSAYYDFEEGAGAVIVDASPFARHGSYLAQGLPTAPALGQGSRALRTTPTQYHVIPSAAFSGQGDFTLAFRVQYLTSDNTVVFERGGNSLSIQTLSVAQSSFGVVPGAMGLTAGGDVASVVVASTHALNDGLPHAVVLGYSSSGVTGCYLLVDGVDRSFRVNHRNTSADGSAWQIGSRAGVSGFGGALDELAFFSRLLSLAEAKSVFPTSDQLTIKKNAVGGRAAAYEPPASMGVGPVIDYGALSLPEPVRLTIESGAVKDYVAGMLGQGIGRIYGTVKRKSLPANLPVQCRVRLIRERDGLLIREVWSDPSTGYYTCDFIDELQKYTVLAYDEKGNFRAVLASGLTPEVP